MKKIVLSGHLEVPDRDLDAVRRALPGHVEATRRETGCITFEITEDPAQPGSFVVYEEFSSWEAFEYHQQRAGDSRWGQVAAASQRHYAIEEITADQDA
ncbi:MAG: putative quinol monooxygenase [Pseudomonadota bacterium]